MDYRHSPHSKWVKFNNRQRELVARFYADNSTEDVAELAGLTPYQVRQIASRIGIKKPKAKPTINEEQLFETIRKAEYEKRGWRQSNYRYPENAVMNYVMVSGNTYGLPIGRILYKDIKQVRLSIFKRYHNAIETYITIPSKANTK